MTSLEIEKIRKYLIYKSDQPDQPYTKFSHSYFGKLLPFFTRNPERPDFSNGFSPVVGVLGRISLFKNSEINFSKSLISDKVSGYFDINSLNDVSNFKELFSNEMISEVSIPYLLTFNEMSQTRQKVGEVQVGEFLNFIFKLDSNKEWLDFISSKNPHNLYEKLVLKMVPELEESKKSRTKFISIISNPSLKNVFDQDLHNLVKSPSFFIKNIDLFFAYYYFFTMTQIILNVDSIQKFSIQPINYALESENISGSRHVSQLGNSLLMTRTSNLLANIDVIDYLNILSSNTAEEYRDLSDILNDDYRKKELLNQNLLFFLKDFYKDDEKSNLEIENLELSGKIDILRKRLIRQLPTETTGRFAKSYEEIAKKYFLKQRGRLGYVLNLNEQLILLLTAAIVGSEKMLVKDVFVELENRGIKLDKISRSKLVETFKKMNILEKLSDSGDAQYVKPIL